MKQYKIIRTRQILRTLKNDREKMGIGFNVCISKIMHMPIKVGIREAGTNKLWKLLITVYGLCDALKTCYIRIKEVLDKSAECNLEF